MPVGRWGVEMSPSPPTAAHYDVTNVIQLPQTAAPTVVLASLLHGMHSRAETLRAQIAGIEALKDELEVLERMMSVAEGKKT